MSEPHNKIGYTRSIDDYSTWSGAHRLCSRIRTYWEQQGYRGLVIEPVRVESADVSNERSPVFALHSNMVNGLPPREAPNEHKGLGQ